MSKNYDNWERLVTAVLRREKDIRIALSHSRDSSISSTSSSFDLSFSPTSQYDIVWDWDRFLPFDLGEIISRAVSPVVYANKKELYFTLCHSPILIDSGKLSFSVEKKSGKKCYMVGARELGIIWCGDTPQYWDYASHPDSRFSEVALLKSVWWLEIRSTINTRILSTNTVYGAYLVFKLGERSYGLQSANAFVRFTNDEVEGEDERKAILDHFARENARTRDRGSGEAAVKIGDGLTEVAVVHLQQPQQMTGRVGVKRGDGWMEVELGSFFCDGGGDGEVETWLLGADGYQGKAGLIVQGVEFRPSRPLIPSLQEKQETTTKRSPLTLTTKWRRIIFRIP